MTSSSVASWIAYLRDVLPSVVGGVWNCLVLAAALSALAGTDTASAGGILAGQPHQAPGGLTESAPPVHSSVVLSAGPGSPPLCCGAPVALVGPTLNIVTGWNLLGNSIDSPLDVVATFGDASKINSIWKWNNTSKTWYFYTPMQTDGGNAYALARGFRTLATVNAGEGFWVNAKQPYSAYLPRGNSVLSQTFRMLPAGWSLISVGDDPTPSSFNAALSSSQPPAGTIPQNFISLWAWDAGSSKWYFYSPELEAASRNALANYITSMAYLDFNSANKKLEPGMGVWVNFPSAALTTTTSSTTSTSSSIATTTSTRTTTSTTTSTTAIAALPCNYAVNPTGQSFGADGGTGSFSVQASFSPCLIQAWSVTGPDWITNLAPYGMSNGNGYVGFGVLPNNSGNPPVPDRQGSITVSWNGGLSSAAFIVKQSGANQFQGSLTGSWAGACDYIIGTISVSGSFRMDIDINGGVTGNYLGSDSGSIAGSVNSGNGGLTTNGATSTGGGSGGILWSGTFQKVGSALRGSGSWTDSGGCSGSWSG